MTGLKTNERPGTKAVLRHYRMSASKARQVLDLIRGEEVETASEILRSTSREAATVVAKVLGSAVANAVHNDGQDAEDLYVSACFADEGTTQKRWRPRARGRATRIRKRTCHITVIVTRLPDERIELRRSQREDAAALRSRRVSESRRRADLSGRLSRRRHAQEEREAAEAEAAREAQIEADLVQDAASEQAAEDVVEAEAERVGEDTGDEEVAEAAALEVAGADDADGGEDAVQDEVDDQDGGEVADAGDEGAADDDTEKGE